jgi:hypothetical protein
MEEIVDYIVDTYEFVIVPCSIPSNEFQFLKRNFYIWVKNNIGEKLFYFLRDRISPIKFLENRPDGSIWLKKRTPDDKLIEIEIQKIYLYDNTFGGYRFSNYSIKTFYDIDSFWLPVRNLPSSGLYNEIQVKKLDIRLINGLIYQIPEIREFSRNKKIENILN